MVLTGPVSLFRRRLGVLIMNFEKSRFNTAMVPFGLKYTDTDMNQTRHVDNMLILCLALPQL